MDTFGAKTDPAILLMHGAGNTMLSWHEDFCSRLAAGGRYVIRYDLDGPDLDALVLQALAQLDGIDRAHVAGLSLGGMVAQRLTIEHPERVASLTLMATTPGGDGLPGPADGLFDNEPPAPDWSDRAAVVDYIVEAERPYSPRFDEAAMRALAERVADRGTLGLQAFLESGFAFGEPWRARLGEIEAPTLVIHGAADPMFPPEHGQALAAEIPGATLLVLPETGHEYPPPRHWDTVVEAIVAHTA